MFWQTRVHYKCAECLEVSERKARDWGEVVGTVT